MATISRNHLSGSTDGRPLGLAIDSGTFTTVHTVTSTAADFEEVYIYLSNISTSQEVVTLRFGGTADGDTIKVKVPAESTVLAVPGLTLQGNSSTAIVITGATQTAGKVNVTGFINTIDAA